MLPPSPTWSTTHICHPEAGQSHLESKRNMPTNVREDLADKLPSVAELVGHGEIELLALPSNLRYGQATYRRGGVNYRALPEAPPEATRQATLDVHWTATIRATSSAYRQATARATRSAQPRAAVRAQYDVPLPTPRRIPPRIADGVHREVPLQIARRVSSGASRQAISGATRGTASQVGV